MISYVKNHQRLHRNLVKSQVRVDLMKISFYEMGDHKFGLFENENSLK